MRRAISRQNSGSTIPKAKVVDGVATGIYSERSSPAPEENPFTDSAYAMNNSIENLHPTRLVFYLTLLTSFCGFMFGYDTGYISSALVVVGTDLGGKEITSGDKELITAATSLGALITALVGGWLADIFGRKWVITFANIMFIVGGAMQTGAHSLWVMIVGRFIMGWGVGLASLVAPMYLSEVAPTRFRGRLVIINVLAITGGQLIAYGIGAGLQNVKNGWRILVGLSLVPSFIQMVMFFFMPETPRYLILRRRFEDARHVIASVYAEASEEQITAKVDQIQGDIPAPAMATEAASNWVKVKGALRNLQHNFKVLFTTPSNFRGLLIIVCLQIFQQFSGWNALMYYSATIFKGLGFKNSAAVSIIIAATNFVFTCLAFLIIDRVGRRNLLVGSMWGMVVGLVLCAVAFQYLDFNSEGDISIKDPTSDKWGKIVIVFMFFFAASYATGIGNVPWQQSEMLPMEVRAVGSGIATAANWSGSLIVSSTFLTMLKNITPTGTFAFYAGICLVGWVLVLFFYPETAGLNLEEIQQLLEGGFNVRKSISLHKQKQQVYRANVH